MYVLCVQRGKIFRSFLPLFSFGWLGNDTFTLKLIKHITFKSLWLLCLTFSLLENRISVWELNRISFDFLNRETNSSTTGINHRITKNNSCIILWDKRELGFHCNCSTKNYMYPPRIKNNLSQNFKHFQNYIYSKFLSVRGGRGEFCNFKSSNFHLSWP